MSHKSIKLILDKFKLNNGYYLDVINKELYSFSKLLMGKYKLVSKPIDNYDLIKRNNQCNYYTFREYNHDIKSLINCAYGMLSVIEYDIEEAEKNNKGLDLNISKENLHDSIKSLESLNTFINDTAKNLEYKFAGNYNLKELILYYLPNYCNYIIIDDSINANFTNSHYIIKVIIESIQMNNNKEIIVKNENNKIIITNFENKLIFNFDHTYTSS
jgi:hypothetical protein